MKEEISAKGIEIEGQYGGYWSNKSKAEELERLEEI